jgi:hypothetical protein
MRRGTIAKYSKEFEGAKTSLDLSTDAQTLLSFLILVVDISYRHRYGRSIEPQRGKGYNKGTMQEVLADQVSPVDDGLLG